MSSDTLSRGRLLAGAKRVHRAWASEHAIYGTILVSALVGVGFDDDTDADVLVFLVGSILVFWIAHLYAGTVSRLHDNGKRVLTFPQAFRQSLRHTAAMLLPMLLPAFFLSLAVFFGMDEWTAYWLALGSGTVTLAVLGYISATLRHAPWYGRLLTTVVTTALGVAVIGLSILAH